MVPGVVPGMGKGGYQGLGRGEARKGCGRVQGSDGARGGEWMIPGAGKG